MPENIMQCSGWFFLVLLNKSRVDECIYTYRYSYVYIIINYIYIYIFVFFSMQSIQLFFFGGRNAILLQFYDHNNPSPSPETKARLAVRCALLDGMLPSSPWPPSG